MAGGDVVQLVATGVPGIVVAGYLLMRLTDRIVFLVGLWLVLRSTPRADRVAAIVAYRDSAPGRSRRGG
jgi:hypothetical protein